jgi:muramoyltetrapeptide carboxypeptidase
MTSTTRRGLLIQAAGACAYGLSPGFAHAAASEPLQTWGFLQPGDVIDVIAPSSPVDNPRDRYATIRAYFANTPYTVNIPDDLIEPTVPLDEANTIDKRARFINDAFHSDSKAIWAIGGGGWGTSILNALKAYPKPSKVKPILGYSDVTALHLYANAYLGFPSIHSVVLGINGDISPGWNKNGIASTLDVLSGKTPHLTYAFAPLNKTAATMSQTVSKVVGGNLLLVTALNGSSSFTLDTKGKFLFLESIADNPGEFSRNLVGLRDSPAIQNCQGVIFGDIIQDGGKPNPPGVQAQFDYIVQRFANEFAPDKIVLKANNLFGHGPVNLPLPFNTRSIFYKDGDHITCVVSANRI